MSSNAGFVKEAFAAEHLRLGGIFQKGHDIQLIPSVSGNTLRKLDRILLTGNFAGIGGPQPLHNSTAARINRYVPSS